MRTRRFMLIVVLLAAPAVVAGRQSTPITFLGVASNRTYTVADTKLVQRLTERIGTPIEYGNQPEKYEDLVREVIRRDDAFVARMTPYAYVAARMLGARVEAVATYLRRDETMEGRSAYVPTYRSYFVVNREAFGDRPETLDELARFIENKQDDKLARFTYTQEFSTSGYFLPALWMRSRHIFATDQGGNAIVRIQAQKLAGGPFTSVIEAVENGGADYAAVWDADKAAYERAHQPPNAPRVRFIPIAAMLPNDLLVCSPAIDTRTRQKIADALKSMAPIDEGDFHSWTPIHEAPDALLALATLERSAAAAPASVVVKIEAADAASEPYLEEARQAVRLSSTEFVLYAPYFHTQHDITWTLQKVHDGALVLTTEMEDPALKSLTQRFQISFTSTDGDLATRIVSLIHSRMHRIRYVWPYQGDAPTIIRDIDVSLPKDTPLKVQRIVWRDPDRNQFSRGVTTDALIDETNPYKFTLKASLEDFKNPLSNVAYRVVLERRSNESTVARALTLTFVGLLLLTAAGAGYDMRRQLRPVTRPPRNLREVCSAMAQQVHDVWRDRTLKDADVLLCARPRIEELIEELKGKGLVTAKMGGVTRWMYEVTGGVSLPLIRGILSGGVQTGRRIELVANPEKVGDTVRLSALIDLLIDQNLLSLFVGRPLEWDALNDLARGILPPAAATRRHERVVRAEDTTVIEIASRHFNQVLDDGMNRVCMFGGTWQISSAAAAGLLMRRQVSLDGPLWIGEEHNVVRSLILEFDLPDKVKLPVQQGDHDIDCWLLGKIVRLTYSAQTGGELCIQLQTLALILTEGVAPLADSQPIPVPRTGTPTRH
jgi:ABC-type phosphate/phosphonate transport system substrate-binding protein